MKSNQVARNIVANLYWRWKLNKRTLKYAQNSDLNKLNSYISALHSIEIDSWHTFLDNYKYLKAVSK